MGVKHLWKILRPAAQKEDPHSLRLAIDTSVWLHHYKNIPPSIFIYHTCKRILKLLYSKNKPVFVFDTGIPHQKLLTQLKRQEVNTRLLARKYISNAVCKICEIPYSECKHASVEKQSDLDKANDEVLRKINQTVPREWGRYYEDEVCILDKDEFRKLSDNKKLGVLVGLREKRKLPVRFCEEEGLEFSLGQINNLRKRNRVNAMINELGRKDGRRIMSDCTKIFVIEEKKTEDKNEKRLTIEDIFGDEEIKEKEGKTGLKYEIEGTNEDLNNFNINAAYNLEYKRDTAKEKNKFKETIEDKTDHNFIDRVILGLNNEEFSDPNKSDFDKFIFEDSNSSDENSDEQTCENEVDDDLIENILLDSPYKISGTTNYLFDNDSTASDFITLEETEIDKQNTEININNKKENKKLKSDYILNTDEIQINEKGEYSNYTENGNNEEIENNKAGIKITENILMQNKNKEENEKTQNTEKNTNKRQDFENSEVNVLNTENNKIKNQEEIAAKETNTENIKVNVSDVENNDISNKKHKDPIEKSLIAENEFLNQDLNILIDNKHYIKEKNHEKNEKDAQIKTNKLKSKNTCPNKTDEIYSKKENLKINITDNYNSDLQILSSKIKEILKAFNLPYIDAPLEADAQCAYLSYMDLVDGVITEDNDIFLYGGKVVYKNYYKKNKSIMKYDIKNIEKILNRDEMIQYAYYLGSDYSLGVKGFGPKKTLEAIKNNELDTKKAGDIKHLYYNQAMKQIEELEWQDFNPKRIINFLEKNDVKSDYLKELKYYILNIANDS